MTLTELEWKVLFRLEQINFSMPDSYWPLSTVLQELKESAVESETTAKNLHDRGLVVLHQGSADCVCITDKGRKALSV